jgi:predicted AlkP superfamily pyrophosphatase or phosphodiesterase
MGPRFLRAIAAWLALAAVVPAQASRPESGPATRPAANGIRLVVLLVIDQLTPEVLAGAWPHLGDDGFRRLAREGVSFEKCAYDHACSETGPGHATLGTGTSPSIHGIVANAWIDASTGQIVGCVDDESVKLIPGDTRGSSAHRLLAPTLGDAMKSKWPEARIVGISIKDRSAILPVGAAADRAVWYDRTVGRFVTSTAFARDGNPAWLAALNALRPVTDWEEAVWTKSGEPGAYADLGPDDSPFEQTLDGSRDFPHRTKLAAMVSRSWFVEAVCASPGGLDLVFGGAAFLVEDAGLGRDEVPDLLSISSSANDLVGHAFGPESHEVRDITLVTDRKLAELFRKFDEVAGAGRWIAALSSDHGIGPIPEALVKRGVAAGRINPDRIKLAVEKAFRERFGPPPGPRTWVKRLYETDILLDRDLLELNEISLNDAQDFAARAAASVPNVAEAIALHSVFDGSLPAGPVYDAIRKAQMAARAADVYILPKPRFVMTATAATHGTPYDYDCRVPLLFAGPGFRRGVRSETAVAPGSVAPTLARALGIPPPAKASYPVLEEALAK